MRPEGRGDIKGINFSVWADNNSFSEGIRAWREAPGSCMPLPTGCVSQGAPVAPEGPAR